MGFALTNSSLYGLADLWLSTQVEVNAKKNKIVNKPKRETTPNEYLQLR